MDNNIMIVNCHKQKLNQLGYKDLLDFLQNPDNIYVGRNMSHFVPGAKGSKWQNPFKSQKAVDMYKNYIRNTPQLYDNLHELKGKTLACWCHPEPCHATALKELYEEKYKQTNINKQTY